MAPLPGQRVEVPPDVVAPVLPLVPVLLLVPRLLPLEDDGDVVVVLPEEPMPEPVVEVDELGIVDDDELGVDVELEAGAPIDERDDGVTLPEAVPPVAPMPDAVPEAEPDIDGPELQAARAAAQAMERMNLVMVELLVETGRNLPDTQSRGNRVGGRESHAPYARRTSDERRVGRVRR